MKIKRRTSQEVTNDMYSERKSKGDLVVIASDDSDDDVDEEDGYWCDCDSWCACRKPEKYFFVKEAFIYRSIRKPSLCFYYEWWCDEYGSIESLLYRFDYKYLDECLQPDMTLNENDYNALKRRRKPKKVLVSVHTEQTL